MVPARSSSGLSSQPSTDVLGDLTKSLHLRVFPSNNASPVVGFSEEEVHPSLVPPGPGLTWNLGTAGVL